MHMHVFILCFFVLLKIKKSDIDFFTDGEDNWERDLKLKEEEGLYPPFFKVNLDILPSAEMKSVKISFEGATEELKIDLQISVEGKSLLNNFISEKNHRT